MKLYDQRKCILGEGALWHPQLSKLFWFDIIGKKLLCDDGREWVFDEHVSAAGWIDRSALLIASETALLHFDIDQSSATTLTALEADNPSTRSNDGRVDPQGEFWIGTMGKQLETGIGAIYRYKAGKLTQLFSGLTIPNAICFSPCRRYGYYADTPTQCIMRVALDEDGWPKDNAEIFIDIQKDNLNPDGAIVDSEGCLWNAQWGASRLARYSQDGAFMTAIPLPVSQVTCPAFGNGSLFATTASEGLNGKEKLAGTVFAIKTATVGQGEYPFQWDVCA